MQRGEPCSFFYRGKWRDGAKFLTSYGFKEMCRVEDQTGLDYLIEEKDVLTPDEREIQKQRAKVEQGKETYADIIKAWDAGIRTAEALAKATDTPRMGINSRIRAARRLGLLK